MSIGLPNVRTSRVDWFVLALLGLSLTLNVLFGVGFLRLTLRMQPMSSRPQVGLAAGTMMPPLDVRKVGGNQERVAYDADSRATIVYVFTPTCVWCERNLDNIKALLTADQQSYRVIGVSLSPDVDAYLKRTGLDFPVYVQPSSATMLAYGFKSTPQTLVIAPDGRLLKVWDGAYMGRVKREVEAFFRIKLPGIAGSDSTPSD